MTTPRRRRPVSALVAACLALAASTAHAADPLNFVACPMVRDTKSVPCWLAEYQGELYFLTIQSDVSAPVTPPWLGHQVLVEGSVTGERICGGIVLDPVHLSVLPERDASCTTMLPAEERYNLTFEPPRPPGPSGGRLAFDMGPAATPAAPRPAPAAGPREFVVSYAFDGLVAFNHAGLLGQVLSFARTANARSIDIVGYRGAVKLSNGQMMVEDASIGRRRAEQIATLLRGANLTTPTYAVDVRDASAEADGVDDYQLRRVVIIVRP